MKFNNIFFDLDGTLIDSRLRLYRLFIDLSGIKDITFEEYWEDKRAMKSNEWILKNKFKKENEAILQFKVNWSQHIESAEYLSFDKLFPDTITTLDQLYPKVTMFLITARQSPEDLSKQLEQLGLTHYFKQILATEQKRTKTALITSVKLPLKNSLIVGDTGEEIITGRELGLATANVLTGFTNKAILESFQPDFIFTDLSDFLITILGD